MEDTLTIEFYKESDEEVFLTAYEQVHGEVANDEINRLYENIALTIQRDIEEVNHILGTPFVYKDVLVGKSDFNDEHRIYLFTH